MKQENKQKVFDLLNNELKNMYHNANPSYPYDLMDAYDEVNGDGSSFDEFYFMASFEVDFMNDGFGHCESDIRQLQKDSRVRKLSQFEKDIQKLYWFSKEYGPFYTYGRGGRTLAPHKLMKGYGGSNYGVIEYDIDDMNITDAIDLYESVKAFNSYVESWNSEENLKALFEDRIREQIDTLESEISSDRNFIIELCQSVKESMKRKKGALCDLVTDRIEESLGRVRVMQSQRHILLDSIK